MEKNNDPRLCPDCNRRKAINVSDVLHGLCPKWFAYRDPEAEKECARFASLKIKANLLPLIDKYYGTKIAINDNGIMYIIALWYTEDSEPSDRELGQREIKCTIEQWRKNEILPVVDPWTGNEGIAAREFFEFSDWHFENRTTYATALKIVEAINK